MHAPISTITLLGSPAIIAIRLIVKLPIIDHWRSGGVTIVVSIIPFHKLSHKSRTRKRRLKKQMTLSPAAVRNINKILPYG